MMTPKRIQRKRSKGWRMPPNTVYVGRPSKWGNHIIVLNGNYENSVNLYRYWLMNDHQKDFRDEVRRELRGKNLACFCSLSHPCHADVLLEVANGNHFPDTKKKAGE